MVRKDHDGKKTANSVLEMDRPDMTKQYQDMSELSPLRLLEGDTLHYTPKHGSWLNMAAIELSVLTNQCLTHRRIDNMKDLGTELLSWSVPRSANQKGIDWQFTTQDARIKL